MNTGRISYHKNGAHTNIGKCLLQDKMYTYHRSV